LPKQRLEVALVVDSGPAQRALSAASPNFANEPAEETLRIL